MNKKYFLFTVVIVFLITAITVISVLLSSINKSDDSSMTEFEIISSTVDFEENISYVSLNSGKIETNLQIDDIFIVCDNVKRDVNYSETKLSKNKFLYSWNKTIYTGELNFYEDCIKTVSLYMEYNGVIIKVLSQEINYKGHYGDPYINFQLDWISPEDLGIYE